jgi:hypothetical protein
MWYGIIAIFVIIIVCAFFLVTINIAGEVKITDFSKATLNNSGYETDRFNVTVENQGNQAVSGLTVVVKTIIGGVELGRDSKQLTIINPGQTETLNFSVGFSYLVNIPDGTPTFTATIQIGAIVLDQKTLK